MAYIYQIKNDINNKIYIGKTNFSIEKRFKEHCRDAFRERNEKRPLYAAMKKYGIKHFFIEQIEETDIPEEREKYWIELLGSFKNGYNATKGGDGKSYVDYDLIYSLWNKGKNVKEISEITHYDYGTVSNSLNNYNISHEERKKRGVQSYSKSVLCLDKDTENIVAIFPSIEEAYRFLQKESSGHIASVCRGKRKTAYGYKWQYSS